MTDLPERVRNVASAANPLVKQLRRQIAESGAYRKTGQVWLEGDHLCRSFLARGGVPLQAVVGERAWQQPLWREMCRSVAQVTVLSDALMATLGTLETPTPGGFLVAVPLDATGVLAGVATVVLDRLQDAGNVGSILRSAAALGVRQVIALKGTAALWSPKVLRAGMGAHFALHLIDGADADLIETLSTPLIATSSHAPGCLTDVTLPAPCTWVLGHEGRGVSEDLLARCALTVRIPQPGGEESLNVAAAAAICLYESARQAPR